MVASNLILMLISKGNIVIRTFFLYIDGFFDEILSRFARIKKNQPLYKLLIFLWSKYFISEENLKVTTKLPVPTILIHYKWT